MVVDSDLTIILKIQPKKKGRQSSGYAICGFELEISDTTCRAHSCLQDACQPHPPDYPTETSQRYPDHRTENHYWWYLTRLRKIPRPAETNPGENVSRTRFAFNPNLGVLSRCAIQTQTGTLTRLSASRNPRRAHSSGEPLIFANVVISFGSVSLERSTGRSTVLRSQANDRRPGCARVSGATDTERR